MKKKIKKQWPKDGDGYYYIENGKVYLGVWSDTEYDRGRCKEYGWFKTSAEAEKALPFIPCDCSEISCIKGCKRNHTHKVFWCGKCRPIKK